MYLQNDKISLEIFGTVKKTTTTLCIYQCKNPVMALMHNFSRVSLSIFYFPHPQCTERSAYFRNLTPGMLYWLLAQHIYALYGLYYSLIIQFHACKRSLCEQHPFARPPQELSLRSIWYSTYHICLALLWFSDSAFDTSLSLTVAPGVRTQRRKRWLFVLWDKAEIKYT